MFCFCAATSSTYIRLRRLFATAFCSGFLTMGAVGAQAYQLNGVNAPLGVFAHVDLEQAINSYVQTTGCSVLPGGVSKASVRQSLGALYDDLLSDQAISGIVLGVHWCAIQLCQPGTASCQQQTDVDSQGNDWSYVDEVFTKAKSHGKSVELAITPGFDSPQWLLGLLGSCDKLITGGKAPGCQEVTFTDYPEASHTDGDVLPLPWSTTYLMYWNAFIEDVYQEIQTKHYQSEFAAIDIDGPVGGSPEIILPTTAEHSYLCTVNGVAIPPQTKCESADTKTHADQMWTILIQQTYPNDSTFPDQAFVSSWTAAIEQFENTFSGVTLILTADAGVRELPGLGLDPQIGDFFQPNAVAIYDALRPIDCSDSSSRSCRAKAEILSFLATEATSVTKNIVATSVGGLTASSDGKSNNDVVEFGRLGNIGVPGVKVLTNWPSSLPQSPPLPQFLGGAQFDFAVSTGANTELEGCLPGDSGCAIPPEQAAYNVFANFFNCTAAGAKTSRTAQFSFVTNCEQRIISGAPIQFINVAYQDVEYAHSHPCPSGPVSLGINTTPAPTCTSMEDLLNQASYALLTTANQPAESKAPTCPFSVATYCAKLSISCHSPPSCCVVNGGVWTGDHCE